MPDNEPYPEEIYATLVEINEQPIELYKVLKIGNLVSGGGEAKQVISEGYVYVNGELESRKRKKIYEGDLISFNGEYLQVALIGQLDNLEIVDVQSRPEEQVENKSPQAKAKRKPISF